jgi:hypothetical protein
MKMNEMFPGKWLKKEDVPVPAAATISRVGREEVNADNGGKEMKVVMAFAEAHLKPMILNIGNATALSELFGDDSANWLGKRVEIYTDPNVMFGGKRVGGLRLRAPSAAAAPAPQPAPVAAPGGVKLWDFSDGQNVTLRQTTEQVLDFLTDLFDQGGNVDGIRVRPHGSREVPVAGSVWRSAHAVPVPAEGGAGDIPF